MKRVRLASASPDEAAAAIRTLFLPQFSSVVPLNPTDGAFAAWRITHPSRLPPPKFRAMVASARNAKPIGDMDFELLLHSRLFELLLHSRLDESLPAKVWLIHGINAASARLDSLHDCDLIVHSARGPAGLDLEAAQSLGLLVTSVPDSACKEIAEVVMERCKVCIRDRSPSSVAPVRMGLIGFGSLGQAIANLATNLGFELWAHDPFKPDFVFERAAIHRAPLHEIAGLCDLVSIQIPLGPDTHNYIGPDYFQFQKHEQWIINTSPREIVNAPDQLTARTIHLTQDIERASESSSARTHGLERALEIAALFLAGEMPSHLLMDPPLPRSVKS